MRQGEQNGCAGETQGGEPAPTNNSAGDPVGSPGLPVGFRYKVHKELSGAAVNGLCLAWHNGLGVGNRTE